MCTFSCSLVYLVCSGMTAGTFVGTCYYMYYYTYMVRKVGEPYLLEKHPLGQKWTKYPTQCFLT